jgi:hypothetical protein
VTLGGMRWKTMKMKSMSLEVNSKWYEELGKESKEGPRVAKYVE